MAGGLERYLSLKTGEPWKVPKKGSDRVPGRPSSLEGLDLWQAAIV